MNKTVIAGTPAALFITVAAAFLPGQTKAANNSCSGIAVVPGTNPQSCDVYPSIVEYTGTVSDGTGVVMRCGWKRGPFGPVPDGEYREIAQRNDAQKDARRLQFIQGTLVATKAVELSNMSTVIAAKLQVVLPNGKTNTRQCSVDTSDDTLANCQPADNFIIDMAEVKETDHNIAGLCTTYIERLSVGGSLTNEDYDASKARAWFGKKNSYIQTLRP